jgi:hypothetical protein
MGRRPALSHLPQTGVPNPRAAEPVPARLVQEAAYFGSMLLRVLVVIVACLSAGVLGGSYANAAGCPTPQEDRVLAKSSTAVVWRGSRGLMGCHFPTGRAVVLNGSPGEDIHAHVAGRFAAISELNCDDKLEDECSSTDVGVWDLRDRREISSRSYDDYIGDDVFALLDDMRVTRGGAAVLLMRIAANREVWLLCPRQADRVAASDRFGPRLEKDGRFVWWLDGQTGERVEGFPPTCVKPKKPHR